MPDPDELLTAIDAARLLRLSTDMVRVLVRQGRLPSKRAANGYNLFRRGDVEQFAAERERAKARGQSPRSRVVRNDEVE